MTIWYFEFQVFIAFVFLILRTVDRKMAIINSINEKPELEYMLGISGDLQVKPVPGRLASLIRVRIIQALAGPEYLDNQGTGAVTLTIPFDTILWRLIATDQSPGILYAICKFELPESVVIVRLMIRRA